jgi:hypothetical protein
VELGKVDVVVVVFAGDCHGKVEQLPDPNRNRRRGHRMNLYTTALLPPNDNVWEGVGYCQNKEVSRLMSAEERPHRLLHNISWFHR